MATSTPMGDNDDVFLMRVSLPDRPGALGAVASAVGTTGADIRAVEIVDKGHGYVVDDFMLTLPDLALPDSVVSACQEIAGVQVLWLSRYPEGGGIEGDIEVVERMAHDPDSAAELLTAAAPRVFHCHWAVLIETGDAGRGIEARATFNTPMAPDVDAGLLEKFGPLDQTHTVDLADGWLPSWGEATIAVAPARWGRAVVLGRQGGPDFLASELARLRHLAGMAG